MGTFCLILSLQSRVITDARPNPAGLALLAVVQARKGSVQVSGRTPEGSPSVLALLLAALDP
jgi:hypothetical protein